MVETLPKVRAKSGTVSDYYKRVDGISRGVERVQSPTRLSISGNAGSPADHPTVKPALTHGLPSDWSRRRAARSGPRSRAWEARASGAIREGFNFVGIEREAEYVEIARKRISHEASKAPIYSGGRAMTAPDAANTPPNRRYVTYPSGRSGPTTPARATTNSCRHS